MFYSHTLLAKKGPLAKVWLAAHLEKKLNRAMIQQTDIKKAAEEIRKPAQPLALRLSGQLLLGITRIYYKKVTLLYEDGQSALKKLSDFFKPGNVDIVETGEGAAAITIEDRNPTTVLDELDADTNRHFDNDFGTAPGGAPNPFGDDENDDWIYGSQVNAKGGKAKAGIPLSDLNNSGIAPEMTMEEAFDAPRSGQRGRISDVEQLRRGENITPSNLGGLRNPVSAGLTGTTDDEERRSAISGSEASESHRRSRKLRPEDLEGAALRKQGRASLLDADGGDDYGMGETMGLDGLGGGDVDMGLAGMDVDYGGQGDYGMDLGAPQSDEVRGAGGLAGADINDEDLADLMRPDGSSKATSKKEKDEAKEREKAEALQKKREAAKAKAREKQSDARVMIPGETIKKWLADASEITKPRLTGNARLAEVYRNLELSRNKMRLDIETGKRPAPPQGYMTAMEIVARQDLLSLSPAVWALVNNGGPIKYHEDPKIDAAAAHMANELGDMRVAHAAAKRRGLIGLRDLSGLGDLTEDGDVLQPCPPILDATVALTQFHRTGGTMVGPALAKLWHDHCLGKIKYPASNRAPLDEAKDDGKAGQDYGAMGQQDVDYGGQEVEYGDYTGGAGAGASAAQFDGADAEWHEDTGAGGTPSFGLKGTPGEAGSAAGSAGRPSSLLAGLQAAGASSSAGRGAGGDEDMEDVDLVDDKAVEADQDEEADGEGAPASASDVDPHKMHEGTVRMLKTLASHMTGPAEDRGASGKAKAGQKRKSREDGGLASWPEGDMADTKRGVGSASDPLSFKAMTEGSTRRTAAVSFYQLLILKSMDVIAVEQRKPCADIDIKRTDRFSVALEAHAE